MSTALILVDIQYDFLPDGALAVPDGDAVIAVANRLAARFDTVVATQDYHPRDHMSFAANHTSRNVGEVIVLDGLSQILWPVHCVQGTRGSELADALDKAPIARVFRKGTNPRVDSYSGFFDNGGRGDTGLNDWLKERGIDAVVVAGLATDYCVKFTALDARRLGFETTVAIDACRGVNLQPTDVDDAIAELRAAGVVVTTSDELGVETGR